MCSAVLSDALQGDTGSSWRLQRSPLGGDAGGSEGTGDMVSAEQAGLGAEQGKPQVLTHFDICQHVNSK